jgi:hypothetical protein
MTSYFYTTETGPCLAHIRHSINIQRVNKRMTKSITQVYRNLRSAINIGNMNKHKSC